MFCHWVLSVKVLLTDYKLQAPLQWLPVWFGFELFETVLLMENVSSPQSVMFDMFHPLTSLTLGNGHSTTLGSN